MQIDDSGTGRARSVREEIEQAFSNTPYPGDDRLVSFRDDMSVALREGFKGKHWRDISRETIRFHHDDLPFFSPAGLRFFLPAYLLAALDDFWDIRDFVLYQLTPFSQVPGYTDKQSYLHRRFDGFSPAEKRAVRRFLEFVRDEKADDYVREKMSPALTQYWGKF